MWINYHGRLLSHSLHVKKEKKQLFGTGLVTSCPDTEDQEVPLAKPLVDRTRSAETASWATSPFTVDGKTIPVSPS